MLEVPTAPGAPKTIVASETKAGLVPLPKVPATGTPEGILLLAGGMVLELPPAPGAPKMILAPETKVGVVLLPKVSATGTPEGILLLAGGMVLEVPPASATPEMKVEVDLLLKILAAGTSKGNFHICFSQNGKSI